MSSEFIQHSITLIDFKATRVQFTVINNPNAEAKEPKFSLDLNDIRIENAPSIFAKVFIVSVYYYDELANYTLKLDVEFHTYFECSSPVDEAFLASDFVKISAPAIGFPFLRAFVSNIALQGGYPPIILPSINFVQFANDKSKSQ